MNPKSGINLFAGFSSANASKDKSLFYNPDSPYSESQYYELKNLIEKCTKKSQNTKLKSISRIFSICESTTDFTLFIDLLPIWIFIFGKLAKYDGEKSVRESTFKLQSLFFTKFKRSFTNFIPELFTPLWLGRNDPVKEVSEAARKAFLTAFPENRHKLVLEKCFPRFVSEITPILQKELNESEEILERLMSCSLLGIKDGILENEICKAQVSIFLNDLKIWSFLENSFKPMVRCAALTCYDTFLTQNMLNDKNLSESCPLVFSLISDKNRLIQQILWGQVLQNLMDRNQSFSLYINPNKLMMEMAACASRGASGAGSTFYMSLVKIVSLLDKEKVQDRKPIEQLLAGIIKGMSSDEGSFHGKFALNAYYEVLLYFYIRDSGTLTSLDAYFTHPVTMYLNCSTPVNNSSYLSAVPGLLSQLLGFLESKGKLPDISENLFQLISSVLNEKVEIAVNFLQEFAKEIGPKGPHCKTLISNLLYTIHGQLSQEIDNLLKLKNLKLLQINLPLYKSFSEVTKKFTSFEPKVFDWWANCCRENLPDSILELIAQCNFIHPEIWLKSLEFSLNSVDQLSYLVPVQYELGLLKVTKTQEFLQIVRNLLEKLKNSENLAEIGKISNCLQRLFYKDMIRVEDILEEVNDKIQELFVNEGKNWSNLAFCKGFEYFMILAKRLNERTADFLGEFLAKHGWKGKLKELWEVFQHLPLKIVNKIVEKGQKSLLSELLSTKDWENLIIVGQKFLNSSPDKSIFIQQLFIPTLFQDFYSFTSIWKLFNTWVLDSKYNLTSYLNSNAWLLCQLLGVEVLPSLINSHLLLSNLKQFIQSVCHPLITSKIGEKDMSFTKTLINELIKLSMTYPAYRVILLKYLKICSNYDQDSNWTQDDLLTLFQFCVEQIQQDSEYTIILCDIIYIFKSLLSQENYNDKLEYWQQKAYSQRDKQSVRIYAACIPDNRLDLIESDKNCLENLIEQGLIPTDMALALSLIRRGGFSSVPNLEKLELLVISILMEGKDLYEVLPYTQRLLASPENIFNKDQLSELLINLPLHNQSLTQPELVEISEALTRLYSIANENIDESGLYQILSTLQHIPLIKSVYSLLSYTYSQFEVKSSNIPKFALELLNYVPNVNSEIMETKTLAYIIAWELLINKYKTERYHREKKKEPASEFMTNFKDLLENSSEIVTVFLTTLMAYLHDESELDLNFDVSWTDILNEDSCAKLCCLSMMHFLSAFPSLGRSWWLGTDRFLSNSVQKVVKKLISSCILTQEIKNIENRQIEWKEQNVNIVCSKAARNISAVFSKSEFSVQVTLQIPNDFPLSPPEPTVTKKVKISEDKVRKWLLSIVQLLQQENSSILELILAWKDHVERELEGIEDCFICYYLVHPTDKSLPNLPCQVCNNKFHKLCIQKWFNSSHNANCPLCRNPFRS